MVFLSTVVPIFKFSGKLMQMLRPKPLKEGGQRDTKEEIIGL